MICGFRPDTISCVLRLRHNTGLVHLAGKARCAPRLAHLQPYEDWGVTTLILAIGALYVALVVLLVVAWVWLRLRG